MYICPFRDPSQASHDNWHNGSLKLTHFLNLLLLLLFTYLLINLFW